jgi:hypothetical protein
VHRRARVRLREDERVLRAREAAGLGLEVHEPLGRFVVGVAQDAQAGAGHAAEGVLAVGVDEVVLAIAEEGEVVVDDPFEERLRLAELLGLDGRRVEVEVGDDLGGAQPHRLPVVDRGPDVAEDALQAEADPVQARRVGLAVDLDVDEGLERPVGDRRVVREHLEERAALVSAHAQHRVDDEVDAAAEPGQLHAHGVDEERHVVVHDLDDGVGRLPAVLLELRRVGADLRLAGRVLRAEAPERDRSAVEVRDFVLEQVLGRHGAVQEADQRLEPRGLLLGELRSRVLDDLLDQTGFRLVRLQRHGSILSLDSCSASAAALSRSESYPRTTTVPVMPGWSAQM